MKKTIEEIRQKNLRQILSDRFDNDTGSLSEAIHRGKSTVVKYLSKNLSRKINMATARSIERSLGLPDGYMDEEYHGTLQVYYVILKVSQNHTFDVVKRVSDYSEAVECSAVLGEHNVHMKVEVPSLHDLHVFFDKLSRMPGVQSTNTYSSIETMRWQRPQSAYSLLKNPNQFTNYAEAYKHRRILEHMEEIQKLEKGRISSDGLLQNAVDMAELMRHVKRSYLIVWPHNVTLLNAKVYKAAEQSRLGDGVKIKRIITLPKLIMNDPMHQEELNYLLDEAKKSIAMGVTVRFLFIENWVASVKNHLPQLFAVVDSEYVFLQNGDVYSQLMLENDDVYNYQRLFTLNWDRSWDIDEFHQKGAKFITEV